MWACGAMQIIATIHYCYYYRRLVKLPFFVVVSHFGFNFIFFVTLTLCNCYSRVLFIAGERLIQYASENLVTEILIHPQYNTLIQCMRNMLSSFTKHRHIIHSGYTFSGNGSWILQVRVCVYVCVSV